MKKMMTVVLVALVPAGSLLAHHSLGNFDTTKAVRVKGTVVEFHQINPHSFIFLNQTDTDGVSRRWAVEGPSILQLRRRGIASDVLKPGDVVEVCGYAPKEAIVWQIARADTNAASPSGRLINGETLVMPDGTEQSWGDYGVHKCFEPEFKDQHSR
jgi:Family of unknown function (DUF6152)